jgi:uncharacterized protein YkwD
MNQEPILKLKTPTLFLLSLAACMPLSAQPLNEIPDEVESAILTPAPRLTEEQFRAFEAAAIPDVAKAAIAKALSPIVVDPSSRSSVANAYNTIYVATGNVPTGWNGSTSPCNPGTTSVAYRDATLDRLNFFRALAGLPGNVTFSASWDSVGQQTALIMAAQNSLSHSPPTNWACYTAAGATGAGESNLALGAGGAEALKLYMDDPGGGNQVVGHRRWILYPPQANMGTGTAGSGTRANALHVFGSGVWGSRPATPNGVAWPSIGYFPYQLLPWGGSSGRWSYSRNGANFANATVSVTVNGVTQTPTVVSRTDNGFGDNTIVWDMAVAPNNPGSDRTYSVTVSGMTGSGIPAQVTYQVVVIDPAQTTTVDTVRFDFNDDGRADILLRNATTGENYLYPMNGTAIVAGEGYIRTFNAPWTLAGLADFNGDGRADMLLRNTTTGENYIYFMNGTTIGSEGYIRSVPVAWTVAAVADFNGDGRADILWRNTTTGENYLYPMNGTAILAGEGYVRSVAAAWTAAAAADFTGDGRADILWRNTATGENYLFPMNGTAILAGEGYIRTFSAPWTLAGIGDVNGDGRADMVLRNTTTGENYLYFMNGTTISSEGYYRSVPIAWTVASVADFNGDGRADILLRNTATGENYLYPMNGTTILAGEGYVRTVPVSWSVVSK